MTSMGPFCLLVGLLAFLGSCLGEHDFQQKRYDGYQVFEISPETQEQLELVHVLAEDDMVDFWTESRVLGVPSYVMLPPHKVPYTARYLSDAGVAFTIYDDDVQKSLTLEQERMAARPQNQAFDVNDFNTYEDIMVELENMAARCPFEKGILCETYSIGQSLEGRDIIVLKITRVEQIERMGYWIDSAIHAREWLAPATNLKIADWLTRGYDVDATVTSLLDTYDFYILPIMNPDGYIYSWTNDRYWRKNRRPGSCAGIDLNRNFDVEWRNAGTSTNPCSQTYGGPSPASEPETQVVSAEAQRLRGSLLAWVSIHTAAQMWLMPWGHTDALGFCVYPDDHLEMMRVCDAAADATQRTYGTRWTRGNTCQTIYPASGGTGDYAKAKGGVKYTFTPELRGPGFVVARSTIEFSYQEMKNGILAMVEAITQAEMAR